MLPRKQESNHLHLWCTMYHSHSPLSIEMILSLLDCAFFTPPPTILSWVFAAWIREFVKRCSYCSSPILIFSSPSLICRPYLFCLHNPAWVPPLRLSSYKTRRACLYWRHHYILDQGALLGTIGTEAASMLFRFFESSQPRTVHLSLYTSLEIVALWGSSSPLNMHQSSCVRTLFLLPLEIITLVFQSEDNLQCHELALGDHFSITCSRVLVNGGDCIVRVIHCTRICPL